MTRAYGRAELPGLGGYWSRLSDEELLEKTFTTGDPESLPYLSEEVPPPDQIPIVEYAYDFRATKRDRIRCVHCKYPNHLAGFVLRLSDGRRFLVGHECGDKLYGAKFNAIYHEFESARSRAVLLKRMRALRVALPTFLDYLIELRRSPIMGAYETTRNNLRTSSRLWGEMVMACYNDHGRLYIDRHIQDIEAEKRADQEYARDLEQWKSMSHAQRKKYHRPLPPAKPIYRTVTELAGQLPTESFFSERPFSRRDFEAIVCQFEQLSRDTSLDERALSVYSLRAKLDKAELDACGSLADTSAYMKQTLWQANTLLDRLQELIAKLAEPARLFRRPMMEIVCRWANEHPRLRCQYTPDGNGLTETDNYDQTRTITLDTRFSVPSVDSIDAFRQAINIEP
jgi:hypothetical protein